MTYRCLVCARPTSTTHMGLDVCRACTVFYRRTRECRDRLVCTTGCLPSMGSRKRLFACRKCRMDRFDELVTTASVETTITLHPTGNYENQGKLIKRIQCNVRALSEFRLIGELRLRGIDMNDYEATGGYNIIPCTYQYMNESTRVLIPGLFEFCRLTFPEFQLLSISDKWLLIRNFEKTFQVVDGLMRELRRFGKDTVKFFVTYTTYLSVDLADNFFSDCADKSHVSDAAKTLHDFIEEFAPIIKKQVGRIDPTDQEFFAMIGLALWSVENLDASDQLLAMAAKYRAEIIAELAKGYRQTIGQEKGTSRIGDLLCLLQEIRVILASYPTHEIYRMLGAFEESSLLYRLPLR